MRNFSVKNANLSISYFAILCSGFLEVLFLIHSDFAHVGKCRLTHGFWATHLHRWNMYIGEAQMEFALFQKLYFEITKTTSCLEKGSKYVSMSQKYLTIRARSYYFEAVGTFPFCRLFRVGRSPISPSRRLSEPISNSTKSIMDNNPSCFLTSIRSRYGWLRSCIYFYRNLSPLTHTNNTITRHH